MLDSLTQKQVHLENFTASGIKDPQNCILGSIRDQGSPELDLREHPGSWIPELDPREQFFWRGKEAAESQGSRGLTAIAPVVKHLGPLFVKL